MAKSKSVFACQHCGFESPKWLGKCPSCQSWNSFVEEIISKEDKTKLWSDEKRSTGSRHARLLHEVVADQSQRFRTEDQELNRVLGGGIVNGSVVLVSGEPGIGKSTLFLQLALQINSFRVLYISGEESAEQIKLRADRLERRNENLFILTETDTQKIFAEIKSLQPQLVIIDSIQTLETPFIESAPGSVSQVRECTAEWVRYAKNSQVAVFIIGHVTKDGTIAGPKVLEHMVDTVLQFEGDRHHSYRILRTLKNRFGNTSELGIYEMRERGLREVSNPSEILLTQKDEALSGIAIAASMEGGRPLLVETQALVSQAVYGTPQRTVSGFDLRRLQLLLAVLEKRGGFHFGMKDVFLNLAGGLRIEDPALDLAVLAALLSSYEDKPVHPGYCFVGEVGLSGEIRAVSRIGQRILEAEKLGFDRIFLSAYNKKGLDVSTQKTELIFIQRIDELYAYLF
ncbi:MAG: DNA repair protein RadA [Chitinophagaceae bacterium]|nr:DNA repair protein RadA [Chitinophagaceae bacterium]